MSLIKSVIISILNNPVAKGISRIPSVKKLAFRYVGAEKIEDFIPKMEEILNSGYKITISFLGEHYTDKHKVEGYFRNVINIIEKVNNYQNISVSIKLTALGLSIDYEYCKENVSKILNFSSQFNIRIHIDMEESVYLDDSLKIFDYFRKELKYNNLDITFQAYLYRTLKDMEDRIFSYEWESKPLVRLCKGAYKEQFDKIFPNKQKIDENYYNLAVKMLDNIDKVYPAFATHDAKLIEKIKSYATFKGISKDNFEFQMLFGVLPDVQKKIIEQGYNLRVYIPIGSEWYEYFVRRVAEKPSNLFILIFSLINKS